MLEWIPRPPRSVAAVAACLRGQGLWAVATPLCSLLAAGLASPVWTSGLLGALGPLLRLLLCLAVAESLSWPPRPRCWCLVKVGWPAWAALAAGSLGKRCLFSRSAKRTG